MLRCVGPKQRSTVAQRTACRALLAACCASSVVAVQGRAQTVIPEAETQRTAAPQSAASGSISGLVSDSDGQLVVGAQVTLTGFGAPRTTVTGSEGRFQFAAVPAGNFRLVITAAGRAPGDQMGELRAGESFDAGTVVLHASADMSIEVLGPHAASEVEVKREEHQRVLGFAPNFYVAYDFNAPALDMRQKWELNWRTLADPVNIGLLAGQAGIEQATGSFSGFGPGAAGYGKRFGAAAGDFLIGNSLAGWILPVVFKQDPRYFYLGTGTRRHRFFYALSTAVIARGDNGKWQPAYANVLGSLGAGAISNTYYPAENRQGATLTFENGLLAVAFDGVGNVLQEFVLKHVSTGAKKP